MTEKLATFRVDEDFWNAFKRKSAEDGVSATTAFIEIGQMYIDGRIDLSAIRLSRQPDEHLDKILYELSQLREGVNAIGERVSALESQPSPKFPSPLGGKRA